MPIPRLIHPTSWKVNSANFASTQFMEVRTRLRRMAPCLALERANPLRGLEAGAKEEVPDDGTYPHRRPSARARRRTDYWVHHLGRSRWDSRVHLPRNAGIAPSPLPWP